MQVAAELERIRAGVPALLAKPTPNVGAWNRAKGPALPRRGWQLVRIDDSGMPNEVLCEACERVQMQHSYVVSNAAWMEGAETFVCRLCACHLMADRAPPPKPARAKPAGEGLRPYGGVASNGSRIGATAAQHGPRPKYVERFRGVKQATMSSNRARRAGVTLPEV